MSGAPETAKRQNTQPQGAEPYEILVEHFALWMRCMEWEARIPDSIWSVEWRGN
jgi:hypothetical protein